MKLITIQLAMVWLVIQAMPHLVHGGGLRGLSSSSAIDSTSNDSRSHDDRTHRHAQEEDLGDLAISTVIPGDMFLPPDFNQDNTNSTAVAEGDIGTSDTPISDIETTLDDDAMGALPLISQSTTPTSTEELAATTTTMTDVDEEANVQEEDLGGVNDQSSVFEQLDDSAVLSTLSDVSTPSDADSAIQSIHNAVPEPAAYICKGGKAEMWVGSHNLVTGIDRAEIWIISSDTNDHKVNVNWKKLEPGWVPNGYKGDKQCAKFFTIGAGTPTPNALLPKLKGELNRKADGISKLSGAVLITNTIDVAGLKKKVDQANSIMNNNFVSNGLRYDDFPPEPSSGGFGWQRFNSNGYVSGLLSYLNQPVKKPSLGNLRGWDKPVPKEFFQNSYYYPFTLPSTLHGIVNKASKKCKNVGKAEVWVGRHEVAFDNDHSKLWVISSNVNDHAKLGIWQDLWPERVPSGYKGDKYCAKFFSVGAESSGGNLAGSFNRGSDVSDDLLGAVLLSDSVDVATLHSRIKQANIVMNANFKQTTLKYELFPADWNELHQDWEEFNSNSYISGLQTFLGYSVKRPSFGNLPGWTKPVPKAFFTSNKTDAQVKAEIIKLYDPSWPAFWISNKIPF